MGMPYNSLALLIYMHKHYRVLNSFSTKHLAFEKHEELFAIVLIEVVLLFCLFEWLCRTMIQNMIKEGKIVPSKVTIKILQKAIQENGNDKFLIDGFPRNEENRAAFEKVVSTLKFLLEHFSYFF